MLLFIHALSPLHVGIGHAPSAIDLPIARDKATGFPIIPGSGLKGALRASAECAGRKDVWDVFGPDTANASESAGRVHFGDAQLVALPVRSVCGTFAWVTSPYLLRRLARDLQAARVKDKDIPALPIAGKPEQAHVGSATSKLSVKGKIYLEDLDFSVSDRVETSWAKFIADRCFDSNWGEFFQDRFLVVHDDIMRYLSVHAIDITSRNRLDTATKTVVDGALWTEENLPTETILTSFVHLSMNDRRQDRQELKNALNQITAAPIQLGGNTTVGRGRCELKLGGA